MSDKVWLPWKHQIPWTLTCDTRKYGLQINLVCVTVSCLYFTGNNNGLCKVRFFYHMLGHGVGTLRVLATDRYSQRTLWTKSYEQSVDWTRAEVSLANMSTSFLVSSISTPCYLYSSWIPATWRQCGNLVSSVFSAFKAPPFWLAMQCGRVVLGRGNWSPGFKSLSDC